MPFDGLSDAEQRAWVVENRAAAAVVWRALDPARFDLATWENPVNGTACALGWLARQRWRGWQFAGKVRGFCYPRMPGWRGYGATQSVCIFFGLTPLDALILFTAGDHQPSASPREVAERVLAAPISLGCDCDDTVQRELQDAV